MTTLDYRGIDEIYSRLAGVWTRRWTIRLLSAAAAVGTSVLAGLLLAGLSLGYWRNQPPSWLRWTVLLAGCGAVGLAVFWYLLRSILWRQNPAQNARFIESNLPQLRNDLINSVLLACDDEQVSDEMVELAIRESLNRSRREDLKRSASFKPLRRWGLALAVATVAMAALCVFQGGAMAAGIRAALFPVEFVPRVNDLGLVRLQPGDTTIYAGEPLTIMVQVENPTGRRLDGYVEIAGAGDPMPMLASDSYSTFTLHLKRVDESFRYAVHAGSSAWPVHRKYFTVHVMKRVGVEGLDIKYDYPAYTKLPSRTEVNADGKISAVAGSRATVTLRLSSPTASAWLELAGTSAIRMDPAGGDTEFSASIPVDKDGKYRIVLKDSRGRTLQRLPRGNGGADVYSLSGRSRIEGFYLIEAKPDRPPKIRFTFPDDDTDAPPGGSQKVRLEMSDGFALTTARLFMGAKGQALQEVHQFQVAGKTGGQFEYEFDLKGYTEGNEIYYYASATDNRVLPGVAGPQTSTSKRFKITVIDRQRLSQRKDRLYEQLRRRLMAILQLQLPQRVNTDICRKLGDLKRIATIGETIRAGQAEILASLVDLNENFPFEPAWAQIHQVVAMLARNEAPLATAQARVLARLKALSRRDEACRVLADTQERIIDTIETLLAILPSMHKKASEKKAAREGGDIPPESREKLTRLKENLEKFIADQRKIIKAAERLTKTPVDNFTAEDEKLLKELLSVQDKWEKFLNEQFTDFSKMAQQDFSNPVLLKELISVKNDVTMAKDALSKKAMEIATAVEDNGIENAKTLTANIEKWLPDEPDRKKWSMEDPAGGQENIEQPELPKELEDLVGDLLEEEEDLFDEIDDVTGKYTISGDKGIGWDAMDGPISNMNAQGVTGNQLPNTNEMGGRSGEGRQGKSTGEFVEDKAVGKGGRRTPTRLTPEPFSKGQVDDKSPEPAGGATGGGKTSGAGGEGLEGPVPPSLARELQRLAGKQAALVNKAEKLRNRYKATDYRNFQLNRVVTLMSRIRKDLEDHKYQNVLRARNTTLEGIRKTHLLLTGKVHVEVDTSSSMPKYIRDDISDAMNGNLPAEYADVLREYYRRLSEQDGK